MTARKWITEKSTYALVIMSVVYAVIGFAQSEKTIGQVIALSATLLIFSWLLSEALETYLEHKRNNNWRQTPTLVLGLFLLAVEIHLVHFGAGWLFSEFGTIMLYLVSAGFSTMTVFAKATFGYVHPEITTEVEPSVLADRLEGLAGGVVIDATDDIVDRTLVA